MEYGTRFVKFDKGFDTLDVKNSLLREAIQPGLQSSSCPQLASISPLDGEQAKKSPCSSASATLANRAFTA